MSGLIVGVGAPDRGDDAVGCAVVEELRRRRPSCITAVVATSPSRLLDLWTGHSPVVVVDAVRTGRRPPGTVSTTRIDDQPLPERTRSGGTHGFGVADALELARALGRLPDRVVLVTVEAVGFDQGASLSPAVAMSVPVAVDVALRVAGGGDE
jgi:hydrogenase maturation protease